MGLSDRRISDVMQTEVVSLAREDRLDLAEDITRLGRIRHMPVLEEGRLVGIVSSGDLLAASLSRALDFEPRQRRTFLRSVVASESMTSDVVTVRPDATLVEAASLLIRRQIGCLAVVKSDATFVGIATETDLLRALLEEEPVLEVSVKEQGNLGKLGERIEEEIDAVRRARDELRVRLHLARADARDRWEELEHRYRELESKLELVAREAGQPVREVGEAVKQLARELREGYRKIRDAL